MEKLKLLKSQFIFLILSGLIFSCQNQQSEKMDSVTSPKNDVVQSPANEGLYSFKIQSSAFNLSEQVLIKKSLKYRFANIEICLMDSSQQQYLSGMAFLISADDVSVEKKTDQRGCLTWTESYRFPIKDEAVTFKIHRKIKLLQSAQSETDLRYVFQSEKNILKSEDTETANLENKNGIVQSQAQVLHSDDSSGFSQSVDLGQQLDVDVTRAVDVNNMIFRFTDRDFANYEVDSLLNLTVAFKTRITFFPSIWKRVGQGESNNEGMKSAQLKIQMAFLRDGYNKQQMNIQDIVATKEFVAQMDKYKVIQDEILKFKNPAALTSKMMLFVTITPMLAQSEVEPTNLEGMFYPITVGSTHDFFLKKSNWSAKEILAAESESKKQMTQKTGLSLLMSGEKMKPLSGSALVYNGQQGVLGWVGLGRKRAENVKVASIASEWLEKGQLPDSKRKSFLQGLCSEFFAAEMSRIADGAYHPDYVHCLKNPEVYFNGQVRWVTSRAQIVRPVPVGLPSVENFSISSNYNASTNNHSEVSRNLRAGANASASAGVNAGAFTPNFLGHLVGMNAGASANAEARVSVGGEAFALVSKSSSFGGSETVSISQNNNLTSEQMQFRVSAVVRKCFVVLGSDVFMKTVAGQRVNSASGFYYCQAQDRQLTTIESYYVIFQNNGQGGSPLSDNLSVTDNPMRMMVRGQSRYSQMKELFSGPLVMRMLNVKSIIKESRKLDLNDYMVNQDMPGMISLAK